MHIPPPSAAPCTCERCNLWVAIALPTPARHSFLRGLRRSSVQCNFSDASRARHSPAPRHSAREAGRIRRQASPIRRVAGHWPGPSFCDCPIDNQRNHSDIPLGPPIPTNSKCEFNWCNPRRLTCPSTPSPGAHKCDVPPRGTPWAGRTRASPLLISTSRARPARAARSPLVKR